MQWLLERNADWRVKATGGYWGSRSTSLEGKTALDLAKAEGNVEAAAALRAWAMEHGTLEPEPEPLSAEEKAELEKTMRQAARKGDAVQVQANLEAGADPNAADLLGETATDHKFSPLCIAAIRGHLEVVDALAAAGAKVDWRDPLYGATALHKAAINGHSDVVISLAGWGAAVDARRSSGETPLHRAIEGLAPERVLPTVKALLEAGADTSIASADGETAVQLAERLARDLPQLQLQRIQVMADVAAMLRAAEHQRTTPSRQSVFRSVW